MMLQVVLLTVATYFIASIPFSLLVGRLFLGKDIREFGDGNPGATNVMRAGGHVGHYLLALILDGFKGLFPVGIPFWYFGWSSWDILPVAIAALLGHAFSIYLGFRGGKAIATTSGIWVGIMVFEALVVIPISLVIWYKVVDEDSWAIVLLMLTLLVYVLITRFGDMGLLFIWLANFGLIVYTHRSDDLMRLPTLRRPKEDEGE